MRVVFLGKGGSGKSTVASSFIQYAAQQGKHVLAIDADVNVHLQRNLQLQGEPQAVGDLFEEVSTYVKGKRTDLADQPIVATTPPSLESTFIYPKKDDPFIQKYALQENNISLLTIGTYTHEDIGHTCYHGKLNTLELIYHHLIDNNDDLVVADATAGIDNLGTSLFFSYDLNVFVVEPTEKSVNVFKSFYEHAKKLGLQVNVIINKFEDGDEEFISQHIPEEVILGSIKHSRKIRQFEQGNTEAFSEFITENKDVLHALYEKTTTMKKDWATYYERLLATHKKNCLEWWDDYYHSELHKQYDPEFQYEKVLR